MVNKNMQTKKRGQVTIFIILAILIVGGILAYVFYIQPTYLSTSQESMRINSCVSKAVENSVNSLLETGGLINPKFTYQYDGKNISYFCYTSENYKTCTVQVPFPEKAFEENLAKVAREEVENCYSSSVDDLRRRGYEVSDKVPEIKMELQPGKIIYSFGSVTITKEATQTLGELKVQMISPVYDMLMVATSILQQEVQYGDSEVTYIMDLYPQFLINKMKRSDGTTIYTITDKATQLKYQFASRSLVWPAGYGMTNG